MVDQLVRVNIGKCNLSKWNMIQDSNPITDDILNLPDDSCCRAVSTPRGLGLHRES